MNHAFVAALAAAGHTAESLAGQLGVHPKTVARWASPGHIPQSRHRATVAGLLAKEADALWPDVVRRREPVWFRAWVDLEREAVTLRSFELTWVPGLLPGVVLVRDTKDRDGGTLTFSPQSWRGFVAMARDAGWPTTSHEGSRPAPGAFVMGWVRPSTAAHRRSI